MNDEWVSATDRLPVMHRREDEMNTGEKYFWYETDEVLAVVGYRKDRTPTVVLGRFIEEKGDTFFEADSLKNVSQPFYWAPLPELPRGKAAGEGKIPAAAVRAGDDLAGEREHENDRGVKNETTNSCASV